MLHKEDGSAFERANVLPQGILVELPGPSAADLFESKLLAPAGGRLAGCVRQACQHVLPRYKSTIMPLPHKEASSGDHQARDGAHLMRSSISRLALLSAIAPSNAPTCIKENMLTTTMKRNLNFVRMSSIERLVIWSALATAMLGLRTATKSVRCLRESAVDVDVSSGSLRRLITQCTLSESTLQGNSTRAPAHAQRGARDCAASAFERLLESIPAAAVGVVRPPETTSLTIVHSENRCHIFTRNLWASGETHSDS